MEELNPKLVELWQIEYEGLSPELKHYIVYASELLKEEMGLKERGSTVYVPLIPVTDEDRHFEQRRDHG